MNIVFDHVGFEHRRGEPVLRDCSLEFGPGVTALVGPNGSGKSTLLRLLTGELAPTRGRVTIDGVDASSLRGRRLAERVAYLSQRSPISSMLTARQIVALARRDTAAVDEALERCDVRRFADRSVIELSEGQRQRVMLARVLAQTSGDRSPMAVALDEPTASLDPRHALAATDHIRDLAAGGHTVVVALHDLAEIERVADAVVLLAQDGSVVRAGPTGEVLTPDTLASVFGVGFERAERLGVSAR